MKQLALLILKKPTKGDYEISYFESWKYIHTKALNKHSYFELIVCAFTFLAISFATKFNENTNDYPELPMSLPKSSDLSFCVWFSVSLVPRDNMNIFSYTSEETDDEFKFILMKDKIIQIVRNEQKVNFSVPFLAENYWNHYCCTWQSNGRVKFFLNYLNVIERRVNALKEEASSGTFSLGRSSNNSTSFNGAISQFFMYRRTLMKSEVLDLFRYRPTTQGLIVNWRNFSRDVMSTKCTKPSHISFPVMKNLS